MAAVTTGLELPVLNILTLASKAAFNQEASAVTTPTLTTQPSTTASTSTTSKKEKKRSKKHHKKDIKDILSGDEKANSFDAIYQELKLQKNFFAGHSYSLTTLSTTQRDQIWRNFATLAQR